jgi:hypothetical protein
MNEQFIERFDLDLITLPETLPEWFITQRQMLVSKKAYVCIYMDDLVLNSWMKKKYCIKLKWINIQLSQSNVYT